MGIAGCVAHLCIRGSDGLIMAGPEAGDTCRPPEAGDCGGRLRLQPTKDPALVYSAGSLQYVYQSPV
jgi:hypothetical protein